MKSGDEVLDLLRSAVRPRPAVEEYPSRAVGRVLREDAVAPEDQPAFDRSAVDGYVIGAEDRSDVFRVCGEIRAGDWKEDVPPPGGAWRIGTGGVVPEGCEVVMLEDAEEHNGAVRMLRRGRDHVRRRGEDAVGGQVLVAAGTRLTEGVLGLLASLGVVRAKITRPVTVLHVVTGDEIVPPGETPRPGQVRDANSPLVAAWARRRGLEIGQRRAGEGVVPLQEMLAGDGCDLTLVSGGASVGPHDGTAEALAAAGFEILVTKVAVRPGKPLIVGRRGDDWAFGLPGNPLSHFACLHVFVGPAVGLMEGAAVPCSQELRGAVTASIPGNPRETWWPAAVEAGGLRPLRWVSSGDLTALAGADALVRVPPNGLAAGDEAGFIRTQ